MPSLLGAMECHLPLSSSHGKVLSLGSLYSEPQQLQTTCQSDVDSALNVDRRIINKDMDTKTRRYPRAVSCSALRSCIFH